MENGRTQAPITDGAVELAPDVPVLVLTDASGVMEALHAGALAVLSERADGNVPCTAIRAAAQGPITLSTEFRDHPFDGSGSLSTLEGDVEEPSPIELTARELQVPRLLAEGSNKSIAQRLDITPHTAKFPRRLHPGKVGRYGPHRCSGQSHAFGARHDLKLGSSE